MIGTQGLNNLTWFMGYIEVSNDASNNDRVKVRAFGFHPTVTSGEVPKDDLPWASVVRQSTDVYTPFNEGDLAFGFFLDGRDAQHPVVLGVINTSRYGIPALAPASVGPGLSAGSTGGNSPGDIGYNASADLQPHARAFLDATALKESVNGRYDIRNGGGTYDINQGHPGYSPGPGGTSSASGRYQFTYDTWLELNGGVNAPMTPANQDAAAWKLAQDRYRSYTGGDLNSQLQTQGLTPSVLSSLGPTWEAFSNSGGHGDIIGQFQNSLGAYANGSAASDLLPENPNAYLAAMHATYGAYGNSALPAQVTGEDIHLTPVVAAETMRRSSSTRSGSSTINEPGVQVGGSKRSSVWTARRNGSYIEMHAGQGTAAEFITIMHSSGSSVRLDQQGNVIIKSSGRTHTSSENNYELAVKGSSTVISDKGYTISVSAGGVTIDSDSDINLTSGGNIRLQAAGDLLLNSGGSLDFASGRIGMHARVDNIDMAAANKIAVQAKTSIGLKSDTTIGLQSNGIGLKAVGNINVGGGKIYLNDSAGTPADVPAALATRAPAPPAAGASSPPEDNTELSDPTPEGVSMGSLDESITAQ
jgi:muramidase (phage lysozyme)/uncharacterized protein (DUF2345 family)